jgi:hypothetical protein
MSPQQVGLSLLVLGLVLLVGKVVRIRSRVAQKLFLPTSIIVGLLACWWARKSSVRSPPRSAAGTLRRPAVCGPPSG